METRVLEDVIESISVTHSFNKNKLIFLNTSDVLAGKILTTKYKFISELKGQAKKSIKNGDILYSEIRPKNKRYAYVKVKNPEDYVVSTKLMVLRNKTDDVDTDYIYYYLTYEETLNYLQKRAENRICSFPQITFDILKPMKIKIPALDEQKKITNILSTLDAKIELNNKINKELETMAKTLYNYWFVQFDFPDEKGKPYKSSGGKMVYNEALKREIPEGWEVVCLGDVTNIIAGGDKPKEFSKIKNSNFSIPIYSNGITNEGLYGFTNKPRIKEQSITVSARGTIGYCVLRNEPFVPIIRLISITPKSNYSIGYFYHSVKNLVFENSGSVQQQLTVPQVSALNILIPQGKVLQIFENFTVSTIKKIEGLKEQTQELTKLRDWLLPMLMNGQVSVK